MAHVVLLNLVFFTPAVIGASAFAWLVLRILRTPAPPTLEDRGDGGLRASRDELARSA